MCHRAGPAGRRRLRDALPGTMVRVRVTSAIPLKSIESIVGPLSLCNLGSTFRSETGFAFDTVQVREAKLKGSLTGEFNLVGAIPLDEAPFRYTVYGNLRLWRLGLRTGVQLF